MSDAAMEDNESVKSDDSNTSNSIRKEKLESLINMELKHSGVFYDLHSKNNLLKVDLENLYSSCQRFESQIKKKTESLEDKYEKLSLCQRNNKVQLKKTLSTVILHLEQTNTSFCGAFEDYSPDVLENSINFLNSEIERLAKNLENTTEELKILRSKEKIGDSLMIPRSNPTSNLEIVTNMLSEMSMKRPEIELEETCTKISNEINKLEQKRQNFKLVSRK